MRLDVDSTFRLPVRRVCRCVAGVVALASASAAPFVHAIDLEIGQIGALLNVDVAYGTRYRLEESDARLIGVANGGRAPSVNTDDGNLNFDEGVVSHMVRGTAEVITFWRGLSFYGRAAAFRDWALDGNLERTPLSSRARELAASGVDVLDHYFGASYTLRGVPLYLRVGDQVVNWSGTTFLREGLDVVSPLDVATVHQSASQQSDWRRPQGMVWAAAGLSDVYALEGYYQYEWKPLVPTPIGTYMSAFDPFGGDGLGSLFLGAGSVSDLGTDLDAHFALPPGTLGFDAGFERIPGREIDEPRDEGQFGVALFGRWLDGPAPEVSVHYMRYHARMPVVSSRTGDAAAIAATTSAAVNATAFGLVDDYLRAGLDATAAAKQARATAESLTVSTYGNSAGLRVEYPEDIEAIGATLSLTSLRRGTLFAAEFARHFDVPFQYAVEPIVAATLSPVQFDPSIGAGPLGEYGPSAIVRGYRRGDRTQTAISLTRLLVKRLGADQVLSGVSVGWVHLHEAPSPGEVPYEPSGHSDDAWGAQVFTSLRYNSVIASLNVTPRIAYSRDLDGTTPSPTATFVEGRSGLVIGVAVDRLQRVEADLGYVRFSGAGGRNALSDRDYVQLRLAVSF